MINASNVSNEIKWPSLYYSYVFSLHDIVKGTALSIITLIVIIANIICLFALRKTQINPATRVLMYSLNAADLCIGIFVALPAAVSAYINDWIFGYPGCFLNVLLGGPTYHTSNLTLLALAVERYIAVAKPFQYRVIFRKTRATVAVGAIWIFSYSYEVVVMGVSRWNVHFHRLSDQCWSITPSDWLYHQTTSDHSYFCPCHYFRYHLHANLLYHSPTERSSTRNDWTNNGEKR